MEHIHATMSRVRQLLSLKPERGRRTITTRVAMGERLQCVVHDGDWTLPVDMTTKSGGDGTAPDAGVYARAALGACVAIAYRMWAAAERIELTTVHVDVEADNDAAGLFGASDVRPAYQAVRLRVEVASPAPAAEVARVLELAEAHSPYLDLFRHGVPVQMTRTIATVPVPNRADRQMRPTVAATGASS